MHGQNELSDHTIWEIVASFQRDGMQNEDEKEVTSRAQS